MADDTGATTAPAPTPRTVDRPPQPCESTASKPTINLVANAWTASALNAEIAKQLIEYELGNPVEIVAIDENARCSPVSSDGTVDAVLEIWPSGITADEQAFLDDGTVVNIGELGAVGKIGWFVPQLRDRRAPGARHLGGIQRPG